MVSRLLSEERLENIAVHLIDLFEERAYESKTMRLYNRDFIDLLNYSKICENVKVIALNCWIKNKRYFHRIDYKGHTFTTLTESKLFDASSEFL